MEPKFTRVRSFRPTRRMAAWLLACTLPFLATYLGNHIHFLRGFPLALQWLSMALVTTLGGLGPGLLVSAIAIGSRIWDVFHHPLTQDIVRSEVVRSVVIFSGAFIIGIMVRRRNQQEDALETALGELQLRTDSLTQALTTSRCAAWILEPESGRSPHWLKGSYEIYGRSHRELESMPTLAPLIHPEDRERFTVLLHSLRDSRDPFLAEHRCIWPDGSIHWLEVRGLRMPGGVNRWRGVTLDITDRKSAEAALLNSEKLAAMGRLASTVAHEINNPLEAVTNLLYLARGDQSLQADTRAYLSMAERELSRLGNITRLTLGFVRTHADVIDVDMAEVVDDVISILQHRLDANDIRIEKHYHPGIQVAIPPHELRQVITNLLSNASDAVHGAVAKPCIAVFIGKEGSDAYLDIEDNGTGIPSSHLARIFDPFFSTKKETGTGIGLWVTKEIIEKNGGRIAVESGDLDTGNRTRFRVELPLVDTASAS